MSPASMVISRGRVLFAIFLLTFRALLTFVRVSFAEGVGTITATLNEPDAECHILARKVVAQNNALTDAGGFAALYIKAARSLTHSSDLSPEQKEQLIAADEIRSKVDATGGVLFDAQADVRIVEEVIRAKRGSVEQCKSILEVVSPPQEVEVSE